MSINHAHHEQDTSEHDGQLASVLADLLRAFPGSTITTYEADEFTAATVHHTDGQHATFYVDRETS